MPIYRVGGNQLSIFDRARSWTGLLASVRHGEQTRQAEPLGRAPRCVRNELAARCLDELAVRANSRGLRMDFFDDQGLGRERPRPPIGDSA